MRKLHKWSIRARWKQSLILNRPGRSRDQVGADMASRLADLEAHGQMVLANPDFVARLKSGAPLNEADRASFFGGAAQGYTDYPALEAATAASPCYPNERFVRWRSIGG